MIKLVAFYISFQKKSLFNLFYFLKLSLDILSSQTPIAIILEICDSKLFKFSIAFVHKRQCSLNTRFLDFILSHVCDIMTTTTTIPIFDYKDKR